MVMSQSEKRNIVLIYAILQWKLIKLKLKLQIYYLYAQLLMSNNEALSK